MWGHDPRTLLLSALLLDWLGQLLILAVIALSPAWVGVPYGRTTPFRRSGALVDLLPAAVSPARLAVRQPSTVLRWRRPPFPSCSSAC